MLLVPEETFQSTADLSILEDLKTNSLEWLQKKFLEFWLSCSQRLVSFQKKVELCKAFIKLIFRFISAEATSFYNILGTDYENFAVVAACNSLCGPVEGLNVWVLSRKPDLNPKFFAEVFEVLKESEISFSHLQRTVQDCNFSLMF